MGQRFVDLGGWPVGVTTFHCWDTVTQKPADSQPYHFLRKKGEAGGLGALRAIQDSIRVFKESFLEAVFAPDEPLEFSDGGVTKEHMTAWRPAFLLGRALHTLQDSFSTEHGIRDPTSSLRHVVGIKSYVCTEGSLQHTHSKPVDSANGDVIWKDMHWYSSEKLTTVKIEHYVKASAKAARDASADLFVAFARARVYHDVMYADTPNKNHLKEYALRELQKFLAAWFSFDREKVLDNGKVLDDDEMRAQEIEEGTEAHEYCQDEEHKPEDDAVDAAREACLMSWLQEAVTEIPVGQWDRRLPTPFKWEVRVRPAMQATKNKIKAKIQEVTRAIRPPLSGQPKNMQRSWITGTVPEVLKTYKSGGPDAVHPLPGAKAAAAAAGKVYLPEGVQEEVLKLPPGPKEPEQAKGGSDDDGAQDDRGARGSEEVQGSDSGGKSGAKPAKVGGAASKAGKAPAKSGGKSGGASPADDDFRRLRLLRRQRWAKKK